MGIYLPNMEMPQKNQMLVIFPDGTSYVCFNGMRERLTQTTAVPIPPHGLIDKQMLLRNIADNQFAHSSVGHEEDYAFWGKVWDYIVDAPTIIESEGEDGL